MMDSNRGDHNCFSKWLLEWITPKVVSAGSIPLELRPSGTSEDAVLVMPNAVNNPFREFFMVQNRSRTGNDDAGNWPADGLLIWHIDGRLDSSGYDYIYNNHTAEHKLIRLMEADGREEIEMGDGRADADDFYKEGATFGHATAPGSKDYAGLHTGVFVKDIKRTQNGISAVIGIESPHPFPAFIMKKAFSKVAP